MHRAPDCIISKSLVQHKITNHHQHHHHQYTLCWCNSSDIGQGSVRQTGGLQTIQCPQSEWGRGRSYKTENAEKEFRLKKAYILYMYNFIKDFRLTISLLKRKKVVRKKRLRFTIFVKITQKFKHFFDHQYNETL